MSPRAALAAGVLGLAVAAGPAAMLSALHSAPTAAPLVTEDSPAWDCLAMGNGTCGPAAPGWMRDGDPTTGP